MSAQPADPYGRPYPTRPAVAPAPSAAVRPYAASQAEYASDAGLVRRMEETLPVHAQVFQLPYVAFPEVPPRHRLQPYDALRPYLHSRTLHWSFPSMRG